jgi:DNA-binding transcriptional regulator YdaS (Cro superfamily)
MNLESSNEDFSPQLLKVLFRKLVDQIGKQDAAAAILGVSRQYISQVCSLNDEHLNNLPRHEHIWRLEQALGRSVVYAGLADAINPNASQQRACLIEETAEVSVAASNAVQTMAKLKLGKASPEEGRAAIEAIKRELSEAEAAFEAQAKIIPMKGAA